MKPVTSPARACIRPARAFVVLAVMGLSGVASNSQAADVSFFGIAKAQQFTQSVGGSPVAVASNAYSFQSFVIAATNGVVTNATVKPSNTTPLRQLTSDTNGAIWRFDEYFNTQAAMDAVYPAGTGFSPTTYAFTMQTVNDGTHVGSLSFWLLPPFIPVSQPPMPTLNNLPAAQTIDHTRDFTLQWSSLGGSTLTIVQLLVLDSASNSVYTSPAPFQPGALDGTATSAVIPANALPPGAALTAHLTAANPGLPDTNSYSGAVGVAVLGKDTQFPLMTRPAPPVPLLAIAAAGTNATVQATALETNRIYHLLTSTNLAAWTELAVTNPVGTNAGFLDPMGIIPERFYRMRVGP